MIGSHRLSGATFDRICAGQGDPEMARLLARTQLSRGLLMMAHLAEREPQLWDAVETLDAAQKYDSGEAAAVIQYPWVCVWAAQCVIAGAGAADSSYLRQVCAAAAKRAGLDTDLGTGLGGFFPTIGMPATEQPVRAVSADHSGHRITVLIDDLDPYRDCFNFPVAGRLTEAQWRSWHDEFECAWRLMAEFVPERCTELSAGLTSIVPLEESRGTGVSITHSDAFGGLGCTRAYDPAQFASTMIHEFQHSKLNALMNLIPLSDPTDQARFAVPWRRDKRPLAGVLHGLYAFTAVAAFWGALRADPAWEPVAAAQFDLVLGQVVEVMRWAGDEPALTPAGKRFTSVLGRSVEALAAQR